MADAAFWYEDQLVGLGAQFLDEVDAALDRISNFPFSYPQIFSEARRALLRRFPFSLYFRVSAHFIEVIAVLHQHRDPSVWQERLRFPDDKANPKSGADL